MKAIKAIITYIKENPRLFLFALFLGNATWYWGLQTFIPDGAYHAVCFPPIDNMIPFNPVFIIFYVMWYAYVAVPMVAFCFFDKETFFRQCATIFSTIYVSMIIFTLYPTMVEFRPDITDNNIFNWMCSVIFSFDKPTNVCPSLHCAEALVIHFSIVHSKLTGNNVVMKVTSAVFVFMVCLSTMFLKQHSVIDAVLGLLLAAVICYFVYYVIYPLERKKHKPTPAIQNT